MRACAAFEGMAEEHETEVDRLLGSLSEAELDALTAMFRRIGKGDAR